MSGLPFQGYPQFINWVPKPKENGKTDKIPVGPTGFAIDPLNPANWMTYENATALASLSGHGVGFVFTKDDPFFFLDIDHARVGNDWSPIAKELLREFAFCYVEVSHSGDGLHIFGQGSYPHHTCKNDEHNLELYTESRFVALTGTQACGDSSFNAQAPLHHLVNQYFPPKEFLQSMEWTEGPCDGWTGPTNDEELIKKAKRSKSAGATFGQKASFKNLFEGNAEVLALCYYSSSGSTYDASSADAALVSHLAFWTGKDCDRIEQLMNLSALGQRDKWVDREDYRQRTILNGVALCRTVYNKPPPPDPVGDIAPDSALRAGNQFMDLNGQLTYFKGCVYVVNRHRVLVPELGLLKPDQFKAFYGGYQFAIAFEGKPTKNAFETFTESQLYTFPKVYGTCFRPENPPGEVVVEEGLRYVNTYFPVKVSCTNGDPTPFLQLLFKILPNERDCNILVSYMAACVQHVGFKFQWAPLLQGVEGNGKTFLATAVSKAVGERYSHFPNAADLTGNGLKFTGWLYEKLFIGIEELFLSGNSEVQEALKDKITNSRVEMQNKGADQFMGDNRANFMFFSNHKEGIRKTKKDRRYAILFSAQQVPKDLTSSGMGGAYFPKLYAWARNGGFAIITDYLCKYAIPEEFNPAGACHRAPVTTSTKEALDLALGAAEQEVLEAIAEGRQGFRGGWVSSVALDALLMEKRKKIALNKRTELLEGLGYVVKGRMNNPSVVDGMKKPVLYITDNSIKLHTLQSNAEITKTYMDAQMSHGVIGGAHAGIGSI